MWSMSDAALRVADFASLHTSAKLANVNAEHAGQLQNQNVTPSAVLQLFTTMVWLPPGVLANWSSCLFTRSSEADAEPQTTSSSACLCRASINDSVHRDRC